MRIEEIEQMGLEPGQRIAVGISMGNKDVSLESMIYFDGISTNYHEDIFLNGSLRKQQDGSTYHTHNFHINNIIYIKRLDVSEEA